MSDMNKMTVAELRAEINGHPRVTTGDMALPGLSKFRKAQLIEILTGLNADAVTVSGGYNRAPVVDVESAANADLAGQIYSASTGAVFTAQERQELNEGKYRGRYAGKSVQLVTGYDRVHGEDVPRVAAGTVVDRVHRESDPLGRGDGSGLLLLVVKHAGLPRVTLHRAEDLKVS